MKKALCILFLGFLVCDFSSGMKRPNMTIQQQKKLNEAGASLQKQLNQSPAPLMPQQCRIDAYQTPEVCLQPGSPYGEISARQYKPYVGQRAPRIISSQFESVIAPSRGGIGTELPVPGCGVSGTYRAPMHQFGVESPYFDERNEMLVGFLNEYGIDPMLATTENNLPRDEILMQFISVSRAGLPEEYSDLIFNRLPNLKKKPEFNQKVKWSLQEQIYSREAECKRLLWKIFLLIALNVRAEEARATEEQFWFRLQMLYQEWNYGYQNAAMEYDRMLEIFMVANGKLANIESLLGEKTDYMEKNKDLVIKYLRELNNVVTDVEQSIGTVDYQADEYKGNEETEDQGFLHSINMTLNDSKTLRNKISKQLNRDNSGKQNQNSKHEKKGQ